MGKCNAPKPGFTQFEARYKWDSWNRLSDMTKEKVGSAR